jgi:NADP-dependent 3-hydroxy-3-methylglutaryl-CoA reductase
VIVPAGHPGPVPGRGHYTERARNERLAWLRRHVGAPLPALTNTRLDARALRGNVENFVGAVEVPLGIAGPLLFDGDQARGYFPAPLATTEGTLVASASRGATAITQCGGVRTRVLSQRMVRAPVWELEDVHAAARFVRWVEGHMSGIRAEVAQVSRHAWLAEVEPWVAGRFVYLRMLYETTDAAGQNMTTACTWRACEWINAALASVPALRINFFAIEGNASGDKKATHANLLTGRGMRVTAECRLDRTTLRDVLKTTPDAMQHGHQIGVLGGIQSGMLGYSINAANVVAAIFVATGQDIACVHESGAGIFTLEADPDGITATMVLPNLVLGTVGGGTGLPAQQDVLEALGCRRSGNAARLAEIVCGFALALELSTQAAVVSGQFADAHERMGRNRPVRYFRRDELSPSFFRPLLAEAFRSPELEATEVTVLEEDPDASIVSEVAARALGHKLVGVVPLRVGYSTARADGSIEVIAKFKALDEEVIIEAGRVASLCGGDLAHEYARWRDWTGFKDTHTRELGIFRSREPRLQSVLPRVYGVLEEPDRELYAIVMERLDQVLPGTNAANHPHSWSRELIDAALRGIAGVHAAWLGREEELIEEGWLGRHLTSERMAAMAPLWRALAEHNRAEYPELVDDVAVRRLRSSIATIDRWWAEIESLPRTLVHNDFNPRNIAIRADGHRLVAYDWELATLHLPQRDLAELLAFVLPPDFDAETVDRHLDVHRGVLESASGTAIDPATWRRGYALALRDFELTRMQLYLMAHTQREYPFVPRVTRTLHRLIALSEDELPQTTLALADQGVKVEG